MPRPAFSGPASCAAGHRGRQPPPPGRPRCARSGRGLSGSTAAAARWCSRSCRAAPRHRLSAMPPFETDRCAMAARVAEVDRGTCLDLQLGHLRPWSHVSDRRSCPGEVVIVRTIASRTASAPSPASAGPFFSCGPLPWPSIGGRCGSIVNRVVRSTSVPMAELPEPRIRSPSQWPGTARSAASAPVGLRRHPSGGASLALADQDARINEASALPAAARPRHAQRPPGAQAGRQLAPQRPAALQIERLVDRLVADAHGFIIRELTSRPPRNLLRAPRFGPAPGLPAPMPAPLPGHAGPGYRGPARGGDGPRQPPLNVGPQRLVRRKLRTLRPTRRPLRMLPVEAAPISWSVGGLG